MPWRRFCLSIFSILPLTGSVLNFRVVFFSLLTAAIFICQKPEAHAQTKMQRFKQLSGPVQRWVLSHPFSSARALKISSRARVLSDSLSRSSSLDGDPDGGQVDAFRHAVWSALLVRELGLSRAVSLTKAYEKGNYREFQQGKLEDGAIQDSVASEMDLRNNAAGINWIAQEVYMHQVELTEHKFQPKDIPETEIIAAMIGLAQSGDLWVVHKNAAGLSLDRASEVIDENKWKGKWVNGRTLVPSGHRGP